MNTFSETQYFSPIIKWVITTLILGMLIFFALVTALDKTAAVDLLPLTITFIIPLIVASIFWLAKLRLTISEQGITYHLTPIEFKEKFIAIEEIDQLALRKQKWFEFGGLGKRRRLFRKQLAYIMNKNYALEVLLKNKRKIIFSIENEKQLASFLQSHFSQLINKNYARR